MNVQVDEQFHHGAEGFVQFHRNRLVVHVLIHKGVRPLVILEAGAHKVGARDDALEQAHLIDDDQRANVASVHHARSGLQRITGVATVNAKALGAHHGDILHGRNTSCNELERSVCANVRAVWGLSSHLPRLVARGKRRRSK